MISHDISFFLQLLSKPVKFVYIGCAHTTANWPIGLWTHVELVVPVNDSPFEVLAVRFDRFIMVYCILIFGDSLAPWIGNADRPLSKAKCPCLTVPPCSHDAFVTQIKEFTSNVEKCPQSQLSTESADVHRVWVLLWHLCQGTLHVHPVFDAITFPPKSECHGHKMPQSNPKSLQHVTPFEMHDLDTEAKQKIDVS